MAKIKIIDLKESQTISKDEMKKVLGGAYGGSAFMKVMPIGVFGSEPTVEFHNTKTTLQNEEDFTGDSTPDK